MTFKSKIIYEIGVILEKKDLMIEQIETTLNSQDIEEEIREMAIDLMIIIKFDYRRDSFAMSLVS